jgi:DNA-directed RNA polymerase subunit beta'
VEEVRQAHDAGALGLHACIRIRMDQDLAETGREGDRPADMKTVLVDTTCGRVLFFEIIPLRLPFSLINRTMDKGALGLLIDRCFRLAGPKATVLLADHLMRLGFEQATSSGVSICINDMVIPLRKQELVDKAYVEVRETEDQYGEGLITVGEKYNKVVDIWAKVTEDISIEMIEGLGTDVVRTDDGTRERRVQSFNSIYMMVDSGARGSNTQIRQLAGMRGLMAKPSGEIIERPITANFREGLTVLEYFISTHGARKGLADTALKTANSGYLTRRLVDVVQDFIVTGPDCGTEDGVEVRALVEAGEVIQPLSERILGRTIAADLLDPHSGEVLFSRDTVLVEDDILEIQDAGVDRVFIRSTLTCEAERGVCVLCYGRDLARGKVVNIGEAIGVIAAQSIGEPGTQLTMRTFHVGGAASQRAAQSTHEAHHDGTLHFTNVRTIVNRVGKLVVMNRNGEAVVVDDTGREKEKFSMVYGAVMHKHDGSRVKKGDMIAEWEPFAIPVLAEVSGKVSFVDIVEGLTMQDAVDEFTGINRKVIIESRDVTLKPRLVIKSPGKKESTYHMPVSANLPVEDGQEVHPGDVLGRIPREMLKTKDITGGLPRVAELFEARKPKDVAVVTEIDGYVSFGKDYKGKRRVVVTPEDGGEPREYLIPKGKHISVREDDYVRSGDALMDGAANPHDLLRIKGEKALARFLVDEVQEVYRLQGVKINDKHIEVIIRQMLKRVRIKKPCDTDFLVDESVEKQIFEAANQRVVEAGGTPAIAEPMLLGITKASLSTESFISAASFQETTRVLTEAAIQGKVDYLRGLKENVIMGRLIPAGTGYKIYQRLGMDDAEEAETAPTVSEAAAS